MPNLAFDAAMLLRGLRAMDAALGESFDVNSHMCIPSSVVYSSEFPKEGLDFQKYQGLQGLKGTWRNWMYEKGGTGDLKSSVHEDVEATVVEAFGILERCDKSKEGLLTAEEWSTCSKGRSAEDQKFDLEYLLALNNVTGKLLIVEKERPLNPADPNTYPELIAAKSDAEKAIAEKDGVIAKKDESISTLETGLAASRKEADLYQKLSYGGFGALGCVALALGIRTILRSRNKPPARQGHSLHPDAKHSIEKDLRERRGEPGALPRAEPKTADPKVEAGTRAVSEPAAVAKPPAPVARTIVAPDNDVADLASALAAAGSHKSPAGALNAGSSLDITADNVILRDPNAPMPAEMSQKVVMAQIVALSPKFLIDDGTAVQIHFRAGVERLADLAIQRAKNLPTNATPISALWEMEGTHQKSRIRGGLPYEFLREFIAQQLEAWEKAKDSTMCFDAAARERMDMEAKRKAGERGAYEKWIERALSDPARLAGR